MTMDKLPTGTPLKLGTNNSTLMPKATGENPSPRRVQEPQKIVATTDDKDARVEAAYSGLVADVIDTTKDQIDSTTGLAMDSHGGIDAEAWAAAAHKGGASIDPNEPREKAASHVRTFRDRWEKIPNAIITSGECRHDVIQHIKKELSPAELARVRFGMVGLPDMSNAEEREWTVGTPQSTAASEAQKIRTAINMGATEITSHIQIQTVKEALVKQLTPEVRAKVHFKYFDPPKGSNIQSAPSLSTDELFSRLG